MKGRKMDHASKTEYFYRNKNYMHIIIHQASATRNSC